MPALPELTPDALAVIAAAVFAPPRGRAGHRGPAQIRRVIKNRKALTIAAPTNTRRVPGREVRSVSAR